MRPHSRWRCAVIAIFCLGGLVVLGLDYPSFCPLPGWQYLADSAAALGRLPESGAEQAILRNQPEIPGLSVAGSRQRPFEFLALPATNARNSLEHVPLGPCTISVSSPVRLGLEAARLRGPPTHQSV